MAAVTAIAARFQSGVTKPKHDAAVTAMLDGLTQASPGIVRYHSTTRSPHTAA
jgi:hypothetical protein